MPLTTPPATHLSKRYLSKMYSDDRMQANGHYLAEEMP